MTARSVYWQDGMFMWPHHMQQEERFQGERIRLSHQWDVQHNWGLRLLDLDADAFKSGRLAIRRLKARLRDGTLVDVPAEGRLPTLDLNELLAANDQVTILLAVAMLHDHHPNTAEPSIAAAPSADGAAPTLETRFLVEEHDVADENSGEDLQALQFRTLNLKLLPDSQDVAGYEVLPIARFEKSPAGTPQLDVNYIPPVLACDAWQPLAVQVLQDVYHHLGTRIDRLADKVISAGITFETQNPGDNLLLSQLAVLNEGSAVLNLIAFTNGIHPFTAYLELCRLVGALAIFTPERRSPKLPAYDHDDLGACFFRVKRHLDEVDGGKVTYEELPFVGEGLRMQVPLDAKWLEAAWQMFVGVQSGLPQAEVIRLLTKAGQLDMKIGSSDRVDRIFEKGSSGLEFTHAAQPPRMLPARAGLTYFQVNRDSQKSEWAQVQQSLSLAIRLNQNRVVSPQGNLQGQRVLTLKPQGAQPGTQPAMTIQFSLFLVPGGVTVS